MTPKLGFRDAAASTAPLVLEYAGIPVLLETLHADKYRVLGPTLRDGSVRIGEIRTIEDLPRGIASSQEAGAFRLVPRPDRALFGFPVGADSWKRFLLPPQAKAAGFRRAGRGFEPEPDWTGAPGTAGEASPREAWFGVRPCDLAAIRILDRVFLGEEHIDPGYQRRREALLIVAVHCTEPAGTCFCGSMGTGPRAFSGFDLALTEITGGESPRYLLETGSPPGRELAGRLPARAAEAGDLEEAKARLDAAAGRMGRRVELTGLKEVLYRNYENPRWEEAGARCLACANCTAVCPTCFCHTVEDVTSLDGSTAERRRRWDSCFTSDFSYLHGGSVRRSFRSRYRQWLVHKFATWQDQFGSPGCVGCGRCITWCPAAIDITEEAAAIRATDPGSATPGRNTT